MSPRVRPAPPDQQHPAATQPPTTGPTPTASTHTPDGVVDLVNTGDLAIADGDAILNALGEPRLKTARQATFSMAIALEVPASAGPAATITRLDDAVHQAVAAMRWTSVHDGPEGYAIDTPQASTRIAGSSAQTVHADVRLTITVPAYRTYRFLGTARQLLQLDLQQLRQRGVTVGPPRRRPVADDHCAEHRDAWWW